MNHPSGPSARWGLAERRLYLCTPDRPDLERFVEACIEGGVDLVQLRDKDLRPPALAGRAKVVQRVCADYNVPFVVNDDPVLAASLGADGVHVGQDDMHPAEARRTMGPDAIIGLSTHAPAELDRALGTGSGSDARPARGGCPSTTSRPGRWRPLPPSRGGRPPVSATSARPSGGRHGRSG